MRLYGQAAAKDRLEAEFQDGVKYSEGRCMADDHPKNLHC